MKTKSLAIGALLLVSLAPHAMAQSGPRAVVAEPVKDIGVVESGATVTHTFSIGNEGDQLLQILDVDPDCGCAVAEFDRNIQPGTSGKVTAVVDVSTFVGPIAKFLRVTTNDPGNPQLLLTLKAEVRPLVQVYPGYARFLTVVDGGELTADQTVWASDLEDLSLSEPVSPYPFVEVGVREAEEGEERSEGRGRQWIVEIALSENAPVGPMADHIVVKTNHPEKPTIRVPLSGFVRPVLAATPPFADFGKREVSVAIRASVRIENFSGEEIDLIGVVSDRPEIQAEIRPEGDRYFVVVTLNPGLPKGRFSSTLTVSTDNARVPKLEIEVRGEVL